MRTASSGVGGRWRQPTIARKMSANSLMRLRPSAASPPKRSLLVATSSTRRAPSSIAWSSRPWRTKSATGPNIATISPTLPRMEVMSAIARLGNDPARLWSGASTEFERRQDIGIACQGFELGDESAKRIARILATTHRVECRDCLGSECLDIARQIGKRCQVAGAHIDRGGDADRHAQGAPVAVAGS